MDSDSDHEMLENITTTVTDDTHKNSTAYNDLIEVINQFDNSPIGKIGANTESDNSQSGHSGTIGTVVCNKSPIVQPGLIIANAECDKSPIEQSSPSTIAEPEAIGYLHNISPIKKGKYFEFQLQERSKTVRGVCFSPPKRKRFIEFDQKDSPVKIKKYRVDSGSNSEDLLMGDDVVINAYNDVDFQKRQLPSTMNISNAKMVCPGQIITIRAKVAHVHPPKRVGIKKLHMQNVVIVDPSGTITLTLWEDCVHQVKQGNTYTFVNIRVRKDKVTSEIVVNTIESDTKIESGPPFQEPLPIIVIDSETVDVEIIGIEKVESYLACTKCSKKIQHTDNRRFIECSHCHFKQKEAAAAKHWFAQVFVENKSLSPTETNRFSVTLFESSIKQIVQANGEIPGDTKFTKELIEDVLFDTSIISMTYNKRNHIVENIISVQTMLN